jgi:hypothetical protein
VATALALSAAGVASPATGLPKTTIFAGALRAAAGAPAADGAYNLQLALYAAAEGGPALWQESHKVAVSGGRFSAALGSANPLDPAALAQAPALFLGVQVEQEPELPRVPVHAALFALHAASAGVAGALACTGCVPVAALKLDDNLDLGTYALKAASLLGETVNAKSVTAQTITATAFVGDGSKLTGLAIPSGQCPSGQVVTGVAGDGKLICAAAAADLAAASGGLLSTSFQESFSLPASDVGLAIPDNTGQPLVSSVTVPDVGAALSAIEVDVELQNSDLSTIAIALLPPDDKKVGLTLCDPCGGVDVKKLKATFPKPTAPKSGDLAAWAGKSPKGIWNLRILDSKFCVAQLDKDNCDATKLTDGKLLHWGLRFQVASSKLVGVQGTLSVGSPASPHSAAGALGPSLLGQAALVRGLPALWTLLAPSWAAQQAVATPGQLVYRTDLAKAFIRLGAEWRELQTTAMCGDGARGASEACDGDDLGGKTCADVKGAGWSGVLGYSASCAFDASGCKAPLAAQGCTIKEAEHPAYTTPALDVVLCGNKYSPSNIKSACAAGFSVCTLAQWNARYPKGAYPGGTKTSWGALQSTRFSSSVWNADAPASGNTYNCGAGGCQTGYNPWNNGKYLFADDKTTVLKGSGGCCGWDTTFSAGSSSNMAVYCCRD